MSIIADLLTVVSAFATARNLSEGRVSTLAFGDGTRLKHLRSGGDMGARRIERAMAWFSSNWPEGANWPADVPRPLAEDEPTVVASPDVVTAIPEGGVA